MYASEPDDDCLLKRCRSETLALVARPPAQYNSPALVAISGT